MPNKRVAFLGPEYTFSHIAALNYFKSIQELDYVSCVDIVEVVKRVNTGKVDYGLIPFWNTGRYYIHAAQEELINSLKVGVIDNFKMKINLNLLSKADTLKKIKYLYTIKHVIPQCEKWLSSNLPNVKLREVKSTALGIKKALSDERFSAIGCKEAAKFYKIHIFAENIQNKINETLFFVIQSKPSFERKVNNYTLVTFPLTNLLKTRAEIQLLLMDHLLVPTQEWPIKFESKDEKWDILEVPGHRTDINVVSFINRLKRRCSSSRIIGSYDTSITSRINAIYHFDS